MASNEKTPSANSSGRPFSQDPYQAVTVGLYPMVRERRVSQHNSMNPTSPPVAKECHVFRTCPCPIVLTVAFGILLFTSVSVRASDKMAGTTEDAAITSEVKEALLFHLLLHSKTETASGVVTLSGNANDMAEKALGTTLATSISGVKAVINNMTVPPTLARNGPHADNAAFAGPLTVVMTP
jgi:hypothetical protein